MTVLNQNQRIVRRVIMRLTLREGLRTHKAFTKDQCFYLNYHKFSIISYVLDEGRRF